MEEGKSEDRGESRVTVGGAIALERVASDGSGEGPSLEPGETAKPLATAGAGGRCWRF